MTLLLIRHGMTSWNEAGRIQGRSDPPLSPAGRAEVERWQLPEAAASAAWICSPLIRARQTAEVLCGSPVACEPRLVEADWGDWEGRRLDELRASGGDTMAANERRGLDFQPPGGESPRTVQGRVRPLLRDLAKRGQDVVAVTHKGVIRAIYALASGWNMRDKPAVKLRSACAHRFTLGAGGAPQVAMLNIPLTPA